MVHKVPQYIADLAKQTEQHPIFSVMLDAATQTVSDMIGSIPLKDRHRFLVTSGWRFMGYAKGRNGQRGMYANMNVPWEFGTGIGTVCQADAITISCWYVYERMFERAHNRKMDLMLYFNGRGGGPPVYVIGASLILEAMVPPRELAVLRAVAMFSRMAEATLAAALGE